MREDSGVIVRIDSRLETLNRTRPSIGLQPTVAGAILSHRGWKPRICLARKREAESQEVEEAAGALGAGDGEGGKDLPSLSAGKGLVAAGE
ncbi:MAG TPA: hypothetical protein VIS96_17290, partial [Terrimicrobiaceae bacterium]